MASVAFCRNWILPFAAEGQGRYFRNPDWKASRWFHESTQEELSSAFHILLSTFRYQLHASQPKTTANQNEKLRNKIWKYWFRNNNLSTFNTPNLRYNLPFVSLFHWLQPSLTLQNNDKKTPHRSLWISHLDSQHKHLQRSNLNYFTHIKWLQQKVQRQNIKLSLFISLCINTFFFSSLSSWDILHS